MKGFVGQYQDEHNYVSIPYRFNERYYGGNCIIVPRKFQFLIGSMKVELYTNIDGFKLFQFLIGSMKVLAFIIQASWKVCFNSL